MLRHVPHRTLKKVMRWLHPVKCLHRPSERAIRQDTPIGVEPPRNALAELPSRLVLTSSGGGSSKYLKMLLAVLGIFQKRVRHLENVVR